MYHLLEELQTSQWIMYPKNQWMQWLCQERIRIFVWKMRGRIWTLQGRMRLNLMEKLSVKRMHLPIQIEQIKGNLSSSKLQKYFWMGLHLMRRWIWLEQERGLYSKENSRMYWLCFINRMQTLRRLTLLTFQGSLLSIRMFITQSKPPMRQLQFKTWIRLTAKYMHHSKLRLCRKKWMQRLPTR